MIEKIPIPDTVDAFDIGSFKYEVVMMLNRIADHLNKQEEELWNKHTCTKKMDSST